MYARPRVLTRSICGREDKEFSFVAGSQPVYKLSCPAVGAVLVDVATLCSDIPAWICRHRMTETISPAVTGIG